jgi:aminoglycoside 2''-phosphotransferase
MTIDWLTVAAEQPGLTIHSVAFLGEGWNTSAYLVNDELVFRCPRRSEVWTDINLEMKFLSDAGTQLPLRVPRYLDARPTSEAAPHGYALYRYIPGARLTLHAMSAKERSAAAEAVASFLRILHSIEWSALHAVLPHSDERDEATELLRQAERIVMPQLTSAQSNALREQIVSYLDASENFGCRPVVRHADLCAEHVLVTDHTVTGVIDFSDVSVGDRDYDFSSLFIDLGVDFVMDVARHYKHPNLDRLKTKLEFFAIADFVDTILHGDGRALEGQQELAWSHLRER